MDCESQAMAAGFFLGWRVLKCAAINGLCKRAGGAHLPAALMRERLGGARCVVLAQACSLWLGAGGCSLLPLGKMVR